MLGHHKRDPLTKIIMFEDKNRLQIPAGSHPITTMATTSHQAHLVIGSTLHNFSIVLLGSSGASRPVTKAHMVSSHVFSVCDRSKLVQLTDRIEQVPASCS